MQNIAHICAPDADINISLVCAGLRGQEAGHWRPLAWLWLSQDTLTTAARTTAATTTRSVEISRHLLNKPLNSEFFRGGWVGGEKLVLDSLSNFLVPNLDMTFGDYWTRLRTRIYTNDYQYETITKIWQCQFSTCWRSPSCSSIFFRDKNVLNSGWDFMEVWQSSLPSLFSELKVIKYSHFISWPQILFCSRNNARSILDL